MTISTQLVAIETVLADNLLTNQMLEKQFPEWSADKIESKTGIRVRGIAGQNECASDLAVRAAEKLFESKKCRPEDIDFLLFCTQSPDYKLPTTACIIQDRLGLSTDCGSLDFNLGCSGFVYGLSLAHGLMAGSGLKNILLLTADTYTKYIRKSDKANRTLFSDGASATLVSATDSSAPSIGPFVFGTDGKGCNNLIVEAGGCRLPKTPQISEDEAHLRVNGGEIFNFAIQRIPEIIEDLLEKSNKTIDDIDRFVFHQANKFILEHLRKKLKIPENKFIINLAEYGNTVSSTIPMALKKAVEDGSASKGQTAMLIGFGVGYSWCGSIITIRL